MTQTPDLTPLDEHGAYRRLLAAMPVMLWTASAQGIWQHVNHEWAAYTGVLGETQGFGFEEALHPDDLERTLTVWQSDVEREEDYEIEYRLRHREGAYRWFLIRGVRVRNEDGGAVAWVGTCTDIDDQKMAELAAQSAQDAAVRALGLALEARDRETQGHTDRVTYLALQLGRTLGLSPAQLTTLRLGAYLHDVGKLAVPDSILLKPGPLTDGERAEVDRHVLEGVRFAAALGFLSDEVLEVIRFHHERWDGAGYPTGLAGETIPLLARVFSVADVYDALISERPYKAAWTHQQALAEVRGQAGYQFDPLVVQALEAWAQDSGPPADALTAELLPADAPALPNAARRVSPAPASTRSPLITPDLSLLAAVWDALDISVVITDARQHILYVNPTFSRQTGYALAEIVGRNPRLLQGPQTDPQHRQALREGLTRQQHLHQLILNYTKSGQPLWFNMHISPILEAGTLRYWVAVQEDASARIEVQRRLEWASSHDHLTELRNRYGLEAQLSTYAEYAVQRGEEFALVVLDLDGFKAVNDTHGHAAGDRVLQGVADALRLHTRPTDQLFRLGGDEFLVVLSGAEENAAQSFADRLQETLAAGDTTHSPIQVSFGLALWPHDGEDVLALVRLADQRMYQSKAAQDGGEAV